MTPREYFLESQNDDERERFSKQKFTYIMQFTGCKADEASCQSTITLTNEVFDESDERKNTEIQIKNEKNVVYSYKYNLDKLGNFY